MTTPVGARLIDQDHTIRSRPMKVLALGMSRTGTSSLRDALILLGHRPFHFSELMLEYQRYIPLWTEALEAKYFNKAIPYGRAEFDKLLGDFDAVEDNPCISFADELIEAYSDAKVILTNRNVDDWFRSMKKTVFSAKQSHIYIYLYRLHPLSRAWFPFVRLVNKIWYDDRHQDGGIKVRERYLEHYRHIRAIVPPENLLELEFGDGWEPLCQFLQVPVPAIPYPHSNDSQAFQRRHRYAKKRLILLVLAIVVMVFISVRVPIQAQVLYWRDPELFRSYLKLLAMISFGLACGAAATNGTKDIEKVLYHAEVRRNKCSTTVVDRKPCS